MNETPLEFNMGDKIWCISDLHVDCPSNFQWVRNLEDRLRDVLIVAGDVCTSQKKLADALTIMKSKFR
jgi:predicted phosphodiesterase